MPHTQVLIVDDEPDIRALLEITLSRMNISTQGTPSLEEAKALISDNMYDLCLTDMHLPDGNGIELVSHIQQNKPQIPVAMITAFGSMETAISALKAGAFDYISKPINLNQLRTLVSEALNLSNNQSTQSDSPSNDLIGSSQAMRQLMDQIRRLARSQAPIYISGESGSGKERVAKMIHQLGPREKKAFVPVNCGAIPAELMESEFFGHKKGSFTGAHDDKPGLFQVADGGTLFLDEVADLPLHMQVKLLRCLQEKKVRPVGAAKEIDVNVRVLCATHKDLLTEVQHDNFREDLYYRLNVIQLMVPPLRDRIEDLPELCNFLMKRITESWGVDEKFTLSDQAQHSLSHYEFPGNVRELENILERAMTLCDHHEILPHDLQLRESHQTVPNTPHPPTQEPPTQAQPPSTNQNPLPNTEKASHSLPDGLSLESYLLEIEKSILLQTLEETRWNRTAAAKKLGLSFRSLRYRLKKLEIDDGSDQD